MEFLSPELVILITFLLYEWVFVCLVISLPQGVIVLSVIVALQGLCRQVCVKFKDFSRTSK